MGWEVPEGIAVAGVAGGSVARLRVMGVTAALAGLLASCTAAPPVPRTTTTATAAPAPAPTRVGPCSETRPPGYVPIRPDGSKPFGATFTHGLLPTDNETRNEPDCAVNLSVRVDREGVFRPTRRTRIDGEHRVYRLYRVTVRNTLPGSVWPIDLFDVKALDGDGPADRAVDLRQQVGVRPSDELEAGRSITWLEAFSDDQGDQTVLVTPYLAGLGGGPQTADIFSAR